MSTLDPEEDDGVELPRIPTGSSAIPSSPREGGRRKKTEQLAAATAVLETIIRRMVRASEKRNQSSGGRSRGGLSSRAREMLAAQVFSRGHGAAGGDETAGHGERSWEVSKEEWNETILDALF